MSTPRPNLSADPQDRDPPTHEPPSKPDIAAIWLAHMRGQLGRPKPINDLYADTTDTTDPPF